MPERIIKCNDAIREATDQMMAADPSVFVIGLGVSYKNGADGTTAGLKAKYPDRIFDVPVSEAGFTGMAVGAAISGLRPVIHHGRIEFALLASDSIFTQAAKWNYMFGGDNPVPAVFRIAIGRAWGNGPQHTLSTYSMFGNVPGLKVVIPSTPYMAKGLLVSALRDRSPVVFLETRYSYGMKQHVPEELYAEPLDKAKVFRTGKSVTVVAYGDGFVGALQACELLNASGNGTDVADIDLIDLVSINPVDHETITRSVQKTGHLLCIDTTIDSFSVGSEIIAKVAQNGAIRLKKAPVSLACPNVACPTSTALTEGYYPTKVDIANAILALQGKPAIKYDLSFDDFHTHAAFVIQG
ncbi:MAG: transketolase C-terminal domain-containing protein [Patescibacteria group bacterium]